MGTRERQAMTSRGICKRVPTISLAGWRCCFANVFKTLPATSTRQPSTSGFQTTYTMRRLFRPMVIFSSFVPFGDEEGYGRGEELFPTQFPQCTTSSVDLFRVTHLPFSLNNPSSTRHFDLFFLSTFFFFRFARGGEMRTLGFWFLGLFLFASVCFIEEGGSSFLSR